MERRTWVVLVLLVVCVGAGVFFARVVGPGLESVGLIAGSDAARIKGPIRVGGDNYLGYWFINSSEFKQRLRQSGYIVNWTNDRGNYQERHKKFADAGYDLMVLPVSSYLFHGLSHRYPGV